MAGEAGNETYHTSDGRHSDAIPPEHIAWLKQLRPVTSRQAQPTTAINPVTGLVESTSSSPVTDVVSSDGMSTMSAWLATKPDQAAVTAYLGVHELLPPYQNPDYQAQLGHFVSGLIDGTAGELPPSPTTIN